MRPLLRLLARTPDPLSDAALLARYAADRDPAAFEVLVWRHGGMVLGVCRRHLRDAHAAEDAFQATFLVLARKAGSVRGETLAGWLHRVARRAAMRSAAKTRRRRETVLVAEPATRPPADGELAAVLDAEIDRLPDRLRQVVVLCYLDGESTESAAARLGIPRGTVLSRLHTARATLAGRLTRRGVTPPVVGLTAVLTADQVAGGVRAASGGFGPVTALANEVLAMSGRKTVLAVAVGLVLAGGAGTGVGVLSAQSGGPPAKYAPAAVAQASDAPVQPVKPSADRTAIKNMLAELDARIADARGKDSTASRLNQQIKTAEAARQHLANETIRVSARRNTIQAQLATMSVTATEQEQALAAKELADSLTSNAEYAARSRLLAELWQEASRAELAGTEDKALTVRLKKATDAFSTVKGRLVADFEKAKRDRQVMIADGHERILRDQLAYTQNELAAFDKSTREAEVSILKWQEELRTLGYEPDQLKLLQAQRDAIGMELMLQTVRANAPSDKLDAILAELRDLRRLVEAKK